MFVSVTAWLLVLWVLSFWLVVVVVVAALVVVAAAAAVVVVVVEVHLSHNVITEQGACAIFEAIAQIVIMLVWGVLP